MQQTGRDVDGGRQHHHEDEPRAHQRRGVPGGGPPQAVHPRREGEPEQGVQDHGAAPEEHAAERRAPRRQDSEQRDSRGQPDYQQRPKRQLRPHDVAGRHGLRQREGQRPLLALLREDVEAEGQHQQRQQVHRHEGEVETPDHQVQGVLDLAVLLERRFVGVDADVVVVRQEVALAHGQGRQGARLQRRGVGAAGTSEDVRGAGVAEGRRWPPSARDVGQLLFQRTRALGVAGSRGLDRPLLKTLPGHAVDEGVDEEDGEHRERDAQRRVGRKQAPLVPQDGPQGHGYATSARRAPAAAARTAPASHNPSTSSDRIRLLRTQPSVGAS